MGRCQVAVEENVAAGVGGVAEILAEHEPLDERRNVVELGLVQEDADFAPADIDLACPQVVEYNGKQLGVTVNEYVPVIVAQRRYAAAK